MKTILLLSLLFTLSACSLSEKFSGQESPIDANPKEVESLTITSSSTTAINKESDSILLESQGVSSMDF